MQAVFTWEDDVFKHEAHVHDDGEVPCLLVFMAGMLVYEGWPPSAGSAFRWKRPPPVQRWAMRAKWTISG